MDWNLLTQPVLPPDDLARSLVLALSDDGSLPHIGIVGDTYTILLGRKDTAGRFCLIDMHIPPGGGPGPHRHDFEETFILMDGELEFVFRGEAKTARSGETVHIPANAPHVFRNASSKPVRLLCLCSPAGQEEFFLQLGVPVKSRIEAPPRPTPEQDELFRRKAAELAPKYKTELLHSPE
ncbi:cupin domain-containing protein [Terriglobus sp. RCC_193]|uniref:cupin domain-containing protein n=1 Tax=Terriglobus sp. RCC_193 TaxID=3239218 RepID=UPI0035256500